MAVVTMNMGGYEIEPQAVEGADHGEEMKWPEWVPELAVVSAWAPARPGAIPHELAGVDVETFLRKMDGHPR